MKKVLLLAIQFTCLMSYGQINKQVDIPVNKTKDGKIDTSSYWKECSKLDAQLNLADLRMARDSFDFRFWTDQQVIDIHTGENNIIQATITSFAQRYNRKLFEKGKFVIDKVFSSTITLDTLTAKRIYERMLLAQLDKIPADNQIADWHEGLDGLNYRVEVSDRQNYVFKTYWMPSSYAKTIKEAKWVQDFIDFLNSDLRIFDYYSKLWLPDGTYRKNAYPGIEIINHDPSNPGIKIIYDLLQQ